MQARPIDARITAALTSVLMAIAGAAWAAPAVMINSPPTITLAPGQHQVCLTATVTGAVSYLWTQAPFTSVGVAYDPASFSAFSKRFGRTFNPSVDLLPTGPNSAKIATPTAKDTCVTFNTATHAQVSDGSFDPMVEPGRRPDPLGYTLANGNRDGAYVITLTAKDGTGAKASASVIVKVRTDADPSLLGVYDDQVPPRDRNGLDVADPNSSHAFVTAAGVDNAGVSAAYYRTIDPYNLRLTQEAWLEENGYNDPRNTAVAAQGYFNHGDLGFGRKIDMVVDKRPGKEGNIAFTTFNYLSAESARLGVDPVSIVNMEYSPIVPGGERKVKFYIYSNDDGIGPRERKLSTDFEGRGEKFLPAVCMACHGGDDIAKNLSSTQPYPTGGETNGTFLALDTRTMGFTDKTTLASLEAAFKEMNKAILKTNPTQATKTLIAGLYGGPTLPLAAQNQNYVPADWQGVDPGTGVDKTTLYKQVIVPSCLSCHTAADTKLLDFAWFKANAVNIREEVFHELRMPNALPSFNNFWLSTNPYQPKLLSDALTAFGAPPN
jgi:mono/diheme cytochrome c family protein